MLKENLQNKILLFKLSSGEDVVTKVLEEQDNFYVVKNPLLVQPIINQKNMGGAPNISIAFIPYMLGRKDTANVKIFKHAIVSISEPEDEMTKKYIESTTNITVANTIPPLNKGDM